MRAYFNHLITNSNQSFTIKEASFYHSLNDFHYHPEIELIYIIEGEGVLFTGDKFEQVTKNSMVLIGSNVPHLFKFERFTYQHSLMKEGIISLPLKLLTLHFNPDVFGDSFMLLPENAVINQLIADALNGLKIYGETLKCVLEIMYRLTNAPKYEHLYLLMQLFTLIAVSNERIFITKSAVKKTYNKTDEMRLTKVYLYTLNNFAGPVKLREVAEIVYMVPNAFCRYFKLRTNKSYFEFLMEVRIRHACKLLKEENYSIVVVCYESGFSNLSNFNRHFKMVTNKTPLAYRRCADN